MHFPQVGSLAPVQLKLLPRYEPGLQWLHSAVKQNSNNKLHCKGLLLLFHIYIYKKQERNEAESKLYNTQNLFNHIKKLPEHTWGNILEAK